MSRSENTPADLSSPLIRRVRIEKLAPTGEGIARSLEGVGFVAGALPGEEVEAEVLESQKNYWRGRTLTVLIPSRDRRQSVPGCGGCDWAHMNLAAARQAKRDLFLESMERIGKIPARDFGELPVEPSPLGYRLRNRFHVSGRGEEVRIGSFAPRTHTVRPVTDCEALSPPTRALLPRVREEIAASGLALSEIATLEDLAGERHIARITLRGDGSPPEPAALRALAARLTSSPPLPPGEPARRSFSGGGGRGEGATEVSLPFESVRIELPEGKTVFRAGPRRLALEVGGRAFLAGADTFFQSNRFLVESLYRHIRDEARRLPPGPALDAFGGVGLFAGALLDAGCAVTSVEGEPKAASDALRTRAGWDDRARWSFLHSSVSAFLPRAKTFPLVLADPPRAGLAAAAPALARLAEEKMIYISCDPATLARDLPAILAEGFEIENARLYDLFALTHRVEAVVTLTRR